MCCGIKVLVLMLAILSVIPVECSSHMTGDHMTDSCPAGEQDKESGCAVAASSTPVTKQRLQESLDEIYAASAEIRDWLHVVITFKNAKQNDNLQKKFMLTVGSLLSLTTRPIIFFVIGDEESQGIAQTILKSETERLKVATTYRVAELDAELMAKELHEIVEPMQRHFSPKPGSYYSDSLFFLSIAIHRVMPESLSKVIMVDADLKFKSDISLLDEIFNLFSPENIIGIARDAQPVYRHTFSLYRSKNKGTRVGEPPPDGLTGFNSGVLLLNLDSMRRSTLYNSYLNEASLAQICDKYKFKGHLGDQDFFTVLSMEHEKLFYVLPCGWNRQLCTWWRDHGYTDIFNQYFTCDETIHILHGNCNTEIPDS